MNKIIRMIALVGVLFSSLTVYSSEIERYEVDVKDFQELKVIDAVNVVYRYNPDSIGKAVFETTREMAPEILFVPSPGKLEIQLATRKGEYDGLPTITVYSNFISKVENDGDSTVTIHNPQPNAKIKLRLVGNGKIIAEQLQTSLLEASIDTGNGTLIVSGKSTAAKLSCTGSGKLLTESLATEEATCKLIGTGYITCDVRDRLTVSGMGTGTIYFSGMPEIKKKMALNIKILPLKMEE